VTGLGITDVQLSVTDSQGVSELSFCVSVMFWSVYFFICDIGIEQVGLVVTLQVCNSAGARLKSWAETPAILSEVSRGFPQSFLANAEIVPQLSHDHFQLLSEPSSVVLPFDAM
jgi:hypothetical protein